MAGRYPAKKVVCAFVVVILFYLLVLTNHKMFGTLLDRVVDITWKDGGNDVTDMTFDKEPPLTNNIVFYYKDVDVREYFLKVKESNIYCLESQAVPISRVQKHVLLLHDSVFTASKWRDYGTLQLLATWGYRALAVDLPGYGSSSKEAVLSNDKLDFFSELLIKLQAHDVVIVAPSIGGLFADPFVSSNQSQIIGIIMVSSVLPSLRNTEDNKIINVPIVVVYGEKDEATNQEVSKLLGESKHIWVRKLPDTELRILDERTSDFHKILFNFLQYLKRNLVR